MNPSKTSLLVLLGIVTVGIVMALAIMFRGGTPPASNGTDEPGPGPGPAAGGCVIGGCSAQLCTDEADGPAVSDCMYRAEYACYKQSKCERQANGQCGWTPSAALTTCLANPPELN